MNRQILVASSNAHKIAEIAALLRDYRILPYTDFLAPIEVLEDGQTFAHNAQKKAQSIFAALPESIAACSVVLADDSGLCVEALGGAPGVMSARYSGATENIDEANNAKLIAELHALGQNQSAAYFACAIALCGRVGQNQLCYTTHGFVHGVVQDLPQGTSGFGYDPLFIPCGQQLTFAQMPPEAKNKLSHRYKAIVLAQILLQAFQSHTLA